ncbi:MAG: hypothetical protein EOO41_00600, partial [Methanobacteriota archaeon]
MTQLVSAEGTARREPSALAAVQLPLATHAASGSPPGTGWQTRSPSHMATSNLFSTGVLGGRAERLELQFADSRSAGALGPPGGVGVFDAVAKFARWRTAASSRQAETYDAAPPIAISQHKLAVAPPPVPPPASVYTRVAAAAAAGASGVAQGGSNPATAQREAAPSSRTSAVATALSVQVRDSQTGERVAMQPPQAAPQSRYVSGERGVASGERADIACPPGMGESSVQPRAHTPALRREEAVGSRLRSAVTANLPQRYQVARPERDVLLSSQVRPMPLPLPPPTTGSRAAMTVTPMETSPHNAAMQSASNETFMGPPEIVPDALPRSTNAQTAGPPSSAATRAPSHTTQPAVGPRNASESEPNAVLQQTGGEVVAASLPGAEQHHGVRSLPAHSSAVAEGAHADAAFDLDSMLALLSENAERLMLAATQAAPTRHASTRSGSAVEPALRASTSESDGRLTQAASAVQEEPRSLSDVLSSLGQLALGADNSDALHDGTWQRLAQHAHEERVKTSSWQPQAADYGHDALSASRAHVHALFADDDASTIRSEQGMHWSPGGASSTAADLSPTPAHAVGAHDAAHAREHGAWRHDVHAADVQPAPPHLEHHLDALLAADAPLEAFTRVLEAEIQRRPDTHEPEHWAADEYRRDTQTTPNSTMQARDGGGGAWYPSEEALYAAYMQSSDEFGAEGAGALHNTSWHARRHAAAVEEEERNEARQGTRRLPSLDPSPRLRMDDLHEVQGSGDGWRQVENNTLMQHNTRLGSGSHRHLSDDSAMYYDVPSLAHNGSEGYARGAREQPAWQPGAAQPTSHVSQQRATSAMKSYMAPTSNSRAYVEATSRSTSRSRAQRNERVRTVHPAWSDGRIPPTGRGFAARESDAQPVRARSAGRERPWRERDMDSDIMTDNAQYASAHRAIPRRATKDESLREERWHEAPKGGEFAWQQAAFMPDEHHSHLARTERGMQAFDMMTDNDARAAYGERSEGGDMFPGHRRDARSFTVPPAADAAHWRAALPHDDTLFMDTTLPYPPKPARNNMDVVRGSGQGSASSGMSSSAPFTSAAQERRAYIASLTTSVDGRSAAGEGSPPYPPPHVGAHAMPPSW